LPEHDRESSQKPVRRLFPRLEWVRSNTVYGSEWRNTWRKAFRVCKAEVFPVYFRFSVPAGYVSTEEVRNFISAADDAAQLANRLRELS
jgi:predicted KAP-like P-loop ATPase